jgi:Galactose binding lectin domain
MLPCMHCAVPRYDYNLLNRMSSFVFICYCNFLLSNVSFLPFTAVASASEVRDYCQSEYFNVTCGRNDVILMEKAQYGRMRSGRCVSAGYGVLGCAVDVLTFFDRRCSGRKHCTIYIGDPALHKLEPCSKDFTTYLEAQYTCLNSKYVTTY